jgi:hypothetical protein
MIAGLHGLRKEKTGTLDTPTYPPKLFNYEAVKVLAALGLETPITLRGFFNEISMV